MDDVFADALAGFNEASTPARGLPAVAYTSDEFWQRECKTVLSQSWVCVGFAHELAEVGDVSPITVGGQPLLLLRNAKGEIAAFHNVCRHRCLKLIDQPGNTGKLIRCPYHAWAYDLDGALRASPHFGGTDKHTTEGFSAADHGLLPVRMHIWHDWIFVNLDGLAPPFEEYAAPLINQLDGFDFSKVKAAASIDFGEIAGNWKLVMENFIEPYHVQFVHSKTTEQPLADHYTIVDDVCLGSGIDLGDNVAKDNSLAVSSRYLTLFPNFILGRYHPDQLGVYLNIPLGPGRTAQKRVIYSTEGQSYSDDDIAALKTLWWQVHKEDHAMIERLQEGRVSAIADSGGILSPAWENSVRAFQELVAQRVQSRGKDNG